MNPVFLIWMAKSYLSEIDRIFKLDRKSIEKYQDKALKKIVKYAYTIPIYRQKYKEAGVKPNDVTGIHDIKKLPTITKEDFRAYSPKGIIPPAYNIKDSQIVRTTGTTSQRLPIYTDFYTIIKTLLGYIRILRLHEVDWKRDRITIIPDLTQWRVGTIYISNTIPLLRTFFSLNNIQILDANENREDSINKLQKFQPDVIGAYPETLRRIATLIETENIRDIKPRRILSTGDYLDKYRKKYIEEIFDSKIFDIYDSTESGPIAFECDQGNYHINSDFVHIGITKNDEISFEGTGEIVVTRLYGGGTPIVSYAGLGDVISIEDNECSCGISTNLMKAIHGRKAFLITLPNGKKIFSSSLEDTLFQTMYRLGTNKIYRAQIIQNKIDQIEILIKIDDKLKYSDPLIEKLMSELEESYKRALNSTVEIVVREVKELEPNTPFVISKIAK